jgi:hypothetical protein
VSLEGVTKYPFEFDPLTICVTDPPPPDLVAAFCDEPAPLPFTNETAGDFSRPTRKERKC